MIPRHANSQDAPRTSVEAVRDETTGRAYLRGTETSGEDRANVFGAWSDGESDADASFDYEGRYYEARPNQPITIEVEVRFAFLASEDIDDHAEVYLWQVYYWKLTDGGATCRKEDWAGGEYVVEAGGLDGPQAIFSPLVTAAVRRIQQARWNKEIIPSRVMGVAD